YHQQQAYQSFLWPNDSPIVECGNYDNCDHRIKDDACWYNVEAE
ncbi:16489_t:CDS:1, partial [Racocetra fulgida]